MTFEKKMLVLKIIIFIGIVGISCYLWFSKSDNDVIYTDGTIIVDEDSIESSEKEMDKLFEFYFNDKGGSPDLTVGYIDEDGNEKYYGAIYTELLVYYDNNPYKIYLMTGDSLWYLNDCDLEFDNCIIDTDIFLAVRDNNIIEVSDLVSFYYKNILSNQN